MKILLDVLNRFNIEGIFPTDEELQQIVDEWKNYDETIEVELDFLELAKNNPNHPYHHMTLPIN